MAQQGMGVGNNNPLEMLDVSGAIKIGTTANVPPGGAGTIRWNGTDFEGWNGTQWIVFAAGPDNDWTVSGSNVFNLANNIGIGTSAPNARLHVEMNNGDFKLLNNAGNSGVVLLGRLQGANGFYPQFRINGNGSLDIGADASGNYVIERNDVARLSIDATGNVGIGTSTPSALLHLLSATNGNTSGIRLTSGGANGVIHLDGSNDLVIGKANVPNHLVLNNNGGVGINTNAPTQALDVVGKIRMVDGFQSTGYIPVSNANGTMTWTDPSAISDGDWTVSGSNVFNTTQRIGIGTNAPSAKLHVELDNGDFRLFNVPGSGGVIVLGRLQGANGFYPQFRINGNGSLDIGADASGNFVIERNDVARITVDASGNVGVGTSTPNNRFDVSDGTRTGSHATSAPLYVTGVLGASSDGVEFRHNNGTQGIGFGFHSIYAAGSNTNQNLNLIPKGTGRVGIGSVTPGAMLHVEGSIRMVDGNQAAGYIPVSDANGTMVWTDPTTISTSYVDEIRDADADTKIQVEETANDDIIRFDVAGAQKWLMTGNRFEPTNANNGVYIGEGAGQAEGASALRRSVFVGENAGAANVSGNNNVAVGYNSQTDRTSGNSNVSIGAKSLESNVSGSNNVAVGHLAGASNLGSGNIFLGKNAGQSEAGSDKLYIANSNTVTPLIYGEFDNDYLQINGTLNVDGNVGIGIATPAHNLHIHKNSSGESYTLYTNSTTGSTVNDGFFIGLDSQENVKIKHQEDKAIIFATNDINRVWIKNDGNVGIGTSNPSQILDVRGQVILEDQLTVSNVDQRASIKTDAANNIIQLDVAGTGHSTDDIYIGDLTNSSNNVIMMGRVGIGTSNPTSQAHVRMPITEADAPKTVLVLDAHDDDNNFNLEAGAGTRLRFKIPGQSGSNIGASIDAEKYSGTETDTRSNLVFRTTGNNDILQRQMTITHDGRVGIGTDDPYKAKVVIEGFHYYNHANGASCDPSQPTWFISDGNMQYSLVADGAIGCPQITVSSDARIKNIEGVSDGATDLETLKQIQISDYTHKDSLAHGNRQFKKVIAQQVAEIYPIAVTASGVSEIPDIMRVGKIENGRVFLTEHGLKQGEKVQLIFGTDRVNLEVEEADKASFKVDCDRDGEVFVYGRHVNDFHSVDYDALSMLNISATQELAKQNEQLAEKVAELETQLQLGGAETEAALDLLKAENLELRTLIEQLIPVSASN